jgi:hypothetical protein
MTAMPHAHPPVPEGSTESMANVWRAACRLAPQGGVIWHHELQREAKRCRSIVKAAVAAYLRADQWIWYPPTPTECGRRGVATRFGIDESEFKTQRKPRTEPARSVDSRYRPTRDEIDWAAAQFRNWALEQSVKIERDEQERRERLWLKAAQERRAWVEQNRGRTA